MVKKRTAYRILEGMLGGKRPVGRLRLRWVYNIKMNLTEIGCDGLDWIDLAQDREQWRTCEHGNEPSGSIKCWEALE
jgi:hypothetical protein